MIRNFLRLVRNPTQMPKLPIACARLSRRRCVKRTRLIDVSVTDTDPERAQLIARDGGQGIHAPND